MEDNMMLQLLMPLVICGGIAAFIFLMVVAMEGSSARPAMKTQPIRQPPRGKSNMPKRHSPQTDMSSKRHSSTPSLAQGIQTQRRTR